MLQGNDAKTSRAQSWKPTSLKRQICSPIRPLSNAKGAAGIGFETVSPVATGSDHVVVTIVIFLEGQRFLSFWDD